MQGVLTSPLGPRKGYEMRFMKWNLVGLEIVSRADRRNNLLPRLPRCVASDTAYTGRRWRRIRHVYSKGKIVVPNGLAQDTTISP